MHGGTIKILFVYLTTLPVSQRSITDWLLNHELDTIEQVGGCDVISDNVSDRTTVTNPL